MKNALFVAAYTLGLSAFFPLMVVHHRSDAALAMFIAPVLAAAFSEVLARLVRFSKERAENRVIWLVAAFVLLSQLAKLMFQLDADDGFTEYLALNALYQIVLVLVFATLEKRPKAAPIVQSQTVRS